MHPHMLYPQTFLEEAKEGGLPLHHVETKDKSQPATQGANVGKVGAVLDSGLWRPQLLL